MGIFEDLQAQEARLREQREREAPRFTDPETGRSVPVAQPQFGIPGREEGETLSQLIARMSAQIARTPQPAPAELGLLGVAAQDLPGLINRLLGVACQTLLQPFTLDQQTLQTFI